MPKKERLVEIIIRKCPESLKKRLKIRAAETGISMQDIAIEALRRYLEREGK
jgi:plasmid stability protein